MTSALVELVGFLDSPRSNVCQVALEHLQGYSQGPERSVFKQQDLKPVRALKKLLFQPEIPSKSKREALTILVNLSDDSAVTDNLLDDEEFLLRLCRSILDLENVITDLACILLANLAKNDKIEDAMSICCHKYKKDSTGCKTTFLSSNLLDCFMDCFVRGSDRSLNQHADFDYLSYFFADFARFKQGRQYLATRQEYDGVVPLTKLLVFCEIKSNIRRAGVASTIKNTLFEVSCHVSLVSDENILSYLLLPLMRGGPDNGGLSMEEVLELPEALQFLDPSKTREPQVDIVCTHLESLLILSTTREVREIMRSQNCYAVIRELDKEVRAEAVSDAVDRLVQILMRDEAPVPEDQENDFVEEVV